MIKTYLASYTSAASTLGMSEEQYFAHEVLKYLGGGASTVIDAVRAAAVTASDTAIVSHVDALKAGRTSITGAQTDATSALTSLASGVKLAKATYSFATSGGAIGDIALDVAIPANSVVTRVMVDVITPFTSGGAATVAIKAESAGDLLAALAVASMTGLLTGLPAPLKTTASRTVTITVAAFALTAGKAYVYVEYQPSAAS